jgi:hypothetical protein
MSRKTRVVSTLPRETKRPPAGTRLQQKTSLPTLWIWLGGLLLLGVILLGVIGYYAWGWVQAIQAPLTAKATPIPVTTLKVQRTAPYAGLMITLVSAQYAVSFSDDDIRSGAGVVRLNMQIANKTSDAIQITYYDAARLLIPKLPPVAPTNVHLSVGPKPGASESGWIDFALAKEVKLDTLALQMGSTALNESLVTFPLTGSFNPAIYADRISQQSVSFNYYFSYYALTYHVTSVEIRFAYKGVQCKGGQRFYIFNFQVDNNNSVDVSTGYGYDYVRLVVSGYPRPPFDNTLPYTFKAGAKGIVGRVAFSGPPGMTTVTVGFLSQNGNPIQDHDITL